MKLQGASTPRPMTHDLLHDMLGELDVSCTRVAVTELRENTFYASITLAVNGREVEIDSRPSDALALAVRSGAPIFAAEEVIAESAIEFEHEVEDTEEVVDKFKEFLDQGHARGLQVRGAVTLSGRPAASSSTRAIRSSNAIPAASAA
jgi:bifunctional DNase/RNase